MSLIDWDGQIIWNCGIYAWPCFRPAPHAKTDHLSYCATDFPKSLIAGG